jgi:hypothetical protein
MTRHLNAAEIQKRIEICRDKAADPDLSTRRLAARHHTSLRVVASALSLPVKDWKEMLTDLKDEAVVPSQSCSKNFAPARGDSLARPFQATRSASGFAVVPVLRQSARHRPTGENTDEPDDPDLEG